MGKRQEELKRKKRKKKGPSTYGKKQFNFTHSKRNANYNYTEYYLSLSIGKT